MALLIVLVFLFILAVIPNADERERIRRLLALTADIERGIKDSDDRIQSEVAAYIENHMDEVAKDLADSGRCLIPTFAGDFTLTVEHLEEIANQPRTVGI